MADIRLIKVFLASPGDVAREGDLVRETLDSINRTFGEKEGVRFEEKTGKPIVIRLTEVTVKIFLITRSPICLSMICLSELCGTDSVVRRREQVPERKKNSCALLNLSRQTVIRR